MSDCLEPQCIPGERPACVAMCQGEEDEARARVHREQRIMAERDEMARREAERARRLAEVKASLEAQQARICVLPEVTWNSDTFVSFCRRCALHRKRKRKPKKPRWLSNGSANTRSRSGRIRLTLNFDCHFPVSPALRAVLV
jgi:hypothetical protein